MDGIQFLSRIKTQSPNTIRVMLTGNADMDTAINPSTRAVFPVPQQAVAAKKAMAKILTRPGAVPLSYGGEELLEQTLSGSIQVLTKCSAWSIQPLQPPERRSPLHPAHLCRDVIEKPLAIRSRRDVVQLGCVTLAPETIDAVYSGKALARRAGSI